ncbi:hypothetical protein HGH93_00350 [Chitinophaga polysaccharea]|uniref:hypothetical protein n=1 Tax=Chitinophaga TaxID=79328 RepID=UPI0014554F69|nr:MULTISPECIES: hypothetical protein [Chitinophaga]NLR56530.1 hypothetical protein [Chitinophaga polysaccharea]NLU92760.1 hypothetical protein [Chitinophaga sp. Ak27]
MNIKKVFLRLKNGANITTSYKKSNDVFYSIHLSFNKGLFKIHSYFLEGDDVFNEQNYKDESVAEVQDFNDFIKILTDKFPGIDILAS